MMSLSSQPLVDDSCTVKKPCPYKPLMIMLITILLFILGILGVLIYIALILTTKSSHKSNKPVVIGISSFRLNETGTGDFNTTKYEFDDLTYVDAIQKAGAAPILLPALTNLSLDLVERQLDLIDVLWIPGGYDVTPSLYHRDPMPLLETTNYITDIYMVQLIKSAYARGMPIMGVCRGLQIINVAFGGTLYQDLSYIEPQGHIPSKSHTQETDGCIPNHTINIYKGSLFAEIFPETETMNVNSYHHQAIEILANDFEVDARAPDGIIESIHKKSGSFVFATQFHPEMFMVCSDSFMPLFHRVISEGRKYADSKAN